MTNKIKDTSRFKFIGHALDGNGPFRPTVTFDANGKAIDNSETYLVRYPRESDEKFARRNELAFFASPLSRVCSRFTSYISAKPVNREVKNNLLSKVLENCDGTGSSIDVFWRSFMVNAKARGSMVMLIDMPSKLPSTQAEQLKTRAAPYWVSIAPELLVDWKLLDNGTFEYAEFFGTWDDDSGKSQEVTFYYDQTDWKVKQKDKILDAGSHGLGQCPLIIFTESDTFPNYGPFAPIADLSKRIFNVDSELDELLRAQTFSILTAQVPEGTTMAERVETAQTIGETVGTNNLLMYEGNQPGFVAPPDGPANILRDRKSDLQAEINDVGLDVATISQQESGVAMSFRFQAINTELATFAASMEDFERRAWEMTNSWLSLTEDVTVEWPRDFNIADTEQELSILSDMQATAMSPEVLLAQQQRVVTTQFAAADTEDKDKLIKSLNNDASAAL